MKSASEWDECFDVVTAVEVLEHVPDENVGPFLSSLASRTRVGGRVILSVPSVAVPLTPKHFRYYDRRLFEEQLSAANCSLRVRDVQYVYHEDWRMRAYLKLSSNRFWNGELHVLQRLVWRHVWTRLRHSTANRGQVMVAILEKSDP